MIGICITLKKIYLKKQKSIRDKKGGRLRSASFKMRLECKIIADKANMVKILCEREHTIAEKRYITLEQFTLGKSSMEDVMKFLK